MMRSSRILMVALTTWMIAAAPVTRADASQTPPAAGARKAPQSAETPTERSPAERPPAGHGAVVVPPVTDPQAVATPPKNIDPGINATPDEQKAKDGSAARKPRK